MKNSQKGFIVPLVITLVALVIGGGAYVYIKNMEVSQTSIAENTQDTNLAPTVDTGALLQTEETAGWETHVNKEIGFSFKYPQGWKVEDLLKIKYGSGNIFSSPSPYDLNDRLRPDVMKAQFSYDEYEPMRSEQDFINRLLKDNEYSIAIGEPAGFIDRDTIVTFTTINGLRVVKYKTGENDGLVYEILQKQDFSKVISIRVWHPDHMFEKVLSTFKFTSPTQVTSTSTQSAVNRGDAVFYITESPDDGYDSQFSGPFHIDLFSNNLLVYSVDSQQSENGVSFVTIKDLPFGEYTSHLKAVGYKKIIDTITFNDNEEGSVFRAILGDIDRVGK